MHAPVFGVVDLIASMMMTLMMIAIPIGASSEKAAVGWNGRVGLEGECTASGGAVEVGADGDGFELISSSPFAGCS